MLLQIKNDGRTLWKGGELNYPNGKTKSNEIILLTKRAFFTSIDRTSDVNIATDIC